MWRITPKEESGLEALRVSPASKFLAGVLVAASSFGMNKRVEAADAVAMTNRPDVSAKADPVLPEAANAASVEKAPRTWTDGSGRFKVEAHLVGVENDLVHLRRQDGTEVSVPVAKLSPADQQYIRGESVGTELGEVRLWKDASGQFEVQASLVESTAELATLRRTDGEVIQVPRSLLSPSDQRFIEWRTMPAEEMQPAPRDLLEQKTSFSFQAVPFDDAMKQIAAMYRAPLWINCWCYLPEQVAHDTPVTGHAENELLGVALNKLLAPYKLYACAKYGALYVGRKASLDRYPDVRVYATAPGADVNALARQIKRGYFGSTWLHKGYGGRCEIAAWSNPPALVIAQRTENHLEITKRLTGLKWVQGEIQREPGHNRIEDALAQPVTIDSSGITISETMQELAKKTGISIRNRVPSPKALVYVKGLSLEAVMNLATEGNTASWISTAENLVIENQGDGLLEKTYSLAGLSYDEEELLAAIKCIHVHSWNKAQKGEASISGNGLRILNLSQVHVAVEQLLADLRSLQAAFPAEQ